MGEIWYFAAAPKVKVRRRGGWYGLGRKAGK
jgi:hypothetical protein